MEEINIDNYKCLTNRVLISIDKIFNNEISVGDVKLYLDTSYDPEKHTVCRGIVEKVCDKLYSGKFDGMEWTTDIEIKPGDEVYFTWMALDDALRKRTYFTCKGKVKAEMQSGYVPCSYSDLTLAVRGKEIIMLNGYVLVEPLTKEEFEEKFLQVKTSELIIDMIRRQNMPGWGRVIACGTPNKEYQNIVYSDNVDVIPGDIVLFKKESDVAVQYDMHADLLGRKKLFKIQRRHLMAKLELPVE